MLESPEQFIWLINKLASPPLSLVENLYQEDFEISIQEIKESKLLNCELTELEFWLVDIKGCNGQRCCAFSNKLLFWENE